MMPSGTGLFSSDIIVLLLPGACQIIAITSLEQTGAAIREPQQTYERNTGLPHVMQ